MAFIETHSPMMNFAGAKAFASDMAQTLRNLKATKPVSKPLTAEDFTARRLRAAQLPAIESCQTGIFSALRQARKPQHQPRAARPAHPPPSVWPETADRHPVCRQHHAALTRLTNLPPPPSAFWPALWSARPVPGANSRPDCRPQAAQSGRVSYPTGA